MRLLPPRRVVPFEGNGCRRQLGAGKHRTGIFAARRAARSRTAGSPAARCATFDRSIPVSATVAGIAAVWRIAVPLAPVPLAGTPCTAEDGPKKWPSSPATDSARGGTIVTPTAGCAAGGRGDAAAAICGRHAAAAVPGHLTTTTVPNLAATAAARFAHTAHAADAAAALSQATASDSAEADKARQTGPKQVVSHRRFSLKQAAPVVGCCTANGRQEDDRRTVPSVVFSGYRPGSRHNPENRYNWQLFASAAVSKRCIPRKTAIVTGGSRPPLARSATPRAPHGSKRQEFLPRNPGNA